MGEFLPGSWEKCVGMNRDGKCGNKNHLSHKKSWGSWYGRVPDQPPAKLQKDNRKRDKKGRVIGYGTTREEKKKKNPNKKWYDGII